MMNKYIDLTSGQRCHLNNVDMAVMITTEQDFTTWVGVPNSNIAIIWIPISQVYVVRCESKNGHHKNI